jgi:hypothetical protein
MGKARSSERSRPVLAAVGGLLVCSAGGLLIFVGTRLGGDQQGLATILGGFGAAGVMVGLLLPLLEGGIEIGPQGVRLALRRLDEVDRKLEQTRDRLDRLFLLTMSPAMYENLRKLDSGRFGHFTISEGLQRELYHLRDIGYIDVMSIQQLPPRGDDLSKHVSVTEIGREFVRLRQESKIDTLA